MQRIIENLEIIMPKENFSYQSSNKFEKPNDQTQFDKIVQKIMSSKSMIFYNIYDHIYSGQLNFTFLSPIQMD
jgi:hypothetical protein